MKFIVKSFIPWASVLLAALPLSTAQAQIVHIAHCMAECPVATDASASALASSEIVVRHLFVAGINRDSSLADWVAYRVLGDSVGVASLLPRWWQQDPLLNEDADLGNSRTEQQPRFFQPDLSDDQDLSYRFNEIVFEDDNRGRLAPMTSFADTPYWAELNNLSNMAPLPAELRKGSWSRLDIAINELAAQEGELYVLSGPLYQIGTALDTETGTEATIEPPVAYFKVVATAESHAAFIFNRGLQQHTHHCDQLATIDQVEQRSGLTLFPALQAYPDTALVERLGCSD